MKKLIAWILITVLGMESIMFSAEVVKAEEKTEEYVVIANDDAGYEVIEEMCGTDIVEASLQSEVLEENHIAVLELTESVAEELENDKDVFLVEENIILCGSGIKREKKKNIKDKKAYQQKMKQKEKKEKDLG
ncbi:MAG: hypothetical protein J6A92_05050 [Lachnospiraceae bacterium]|nr:hypothetical protein [Lachnospiraceae bacterium]